MSHIATLDPVPTVCTSLSGRHPPLWTHAKLRTLYDYWLGRRPDPSALPSRRDIDPADFPTLLGNVFLLNVNEDEPRFTYRVAGQKLSWLHQTPLTGKPLGTGLSAVHGLEAETRRWTSCAGGNLLGAAGILAGAAVVISISRNSFCLSADPTVTWRCCSASW